MAESMCGPSNHLKTLQNYASSDRTLQQDILLSRQPRQKEFRSSAGPSTAKAEAEFEIFQNGFLPIENAFQPSDMAYESPLSSYQSSQPPQLSTWALDFQNLNFSDNHPRTGQNKATPQAQKIYENNCEWYQGLNQQPQLRKADVLFRRNNTLNMMNGRKITIPSVNGLDETLDYNQNALLYQGQQKQPVGEIFDQDDFARVFEQVTETELNSTQEVFSQNSTYSDDNISVSKSLNYTTSPLKDNVHLIQDPIGADAINSEKSVVEEDSDSLSRTALGLLNSVQGEQNEKFQNSQFLELMRRFRDKKAIVEGNQVVGEVLHPTSYDESTIVGELEPISSHRSELTQ